MFNNFYQLPGCILLLEELKDQDQDGLARCDFFSGFDFPGYSSGYSLKEGTLMEKSLLILQCS